MDDCSIEYTEWDVVDDYIDRAKEEGWFCEAYPMPVSMPVATPVESPSHD